MKKYILFTVLCLLPLLSFAQKRVLFTISPLSLFNADQSIQGGVELPLGIKYSLQQDFGYFFYRIPGISNKYNELINGFISKTELKYFTQQFASQSKNSIIKRQGRYVSVQIIYKKINYTAGNFKFFCDNYSSYKDEYYYNLFYKENFDYTKKTVYSMLINAGREYVYKSNFVLDVFFGLGIREIINSGPCHYIYLQTNKAIEDTVTIKDIFIFPMITGGFRIGFAL